jgi:hypothetical protein
MRLMSSSTASRIVRLRPYAPIADGSVQTLEVQVECTASVLNLQYSLSADLDRLKIPAPKPMRRADELWKHTCFEAFLRSATGTGYCEVNIAPSTEWAVYSFDDYRQGMKPANVPQPPVIAVDRSVGRLTVDVQIDLKVLPPSRALALTAVLEHEGGSLSYWSLQHPAAKPDFHHPDGFVFQIQEVAP